MRCYGIHSLHLIHGTAATTLFSSSPAFLGSDSSSLMESEDMKVRCDRPPMGFCIRDIDICLFSGWRWLFLVEAIITFSVGFITFWNMPPSPTKTRTWFRPNGWFTEREEVIMTNRILRDDPGSESAALLLLLFFSQLELVYSLFFKEGLMHNRQAITWSMLWESITDYDLWPLYLVSCSKSWTE